MTRMCRIPVKLLAGCQSSPGFSGNFQGLRCLAWVALTVSLVRSDGCPSFGTEERKDDKTEDRDRCRGSAGVLLQELSEQLHESRRCGRANGAQKGERRGCVGLGKECLEEVSEVLWLISFAFLNFGDIKSLLCGNAVWLVADDPIYALYALCCHQPMLVVSVQPTMVSHIISRQGRLVVCLIMKN